MQIGIIGLGKMGFNLALNLQRNGYEVVAQDVNTDFITKIGLALSIMMRYRSQMQDTFSGKVVAALRNEFGGHAVEKNE